MLRILSVKDFHGSIRQGKIFKEYQNTFSLYLIIRKYSTEKTKFSLPKKKKSRKPHGRFSGRHYSFTMVTEAILWGFRGLSDQLVATPAMRSSTSKPSVSLPKAA